METTIKQTALEGAVHRVFGKKPLEEYDGNVFFSTMEIHDGRNLHYGRKVQIDSRSPASVNASQAKGRFIEHFFVQSGSTSVLADLVPKTKMYEVHIYNGSKIKGRICRTEAELVDVLQGELRKSA